MNKLDQQSLVGLFEEIILSEQNITEMISQLKGEGFNASEWFKLLRGDNQVITIDLFMEDFTQNNICTSDQLYQIFSKFDVNRNGFITRDDFEKFFSRGRIQKTTKKILNAKLIHEKFQALLQMILENNRILHVARQPLQLIPLYSMFDCIDVNCIGQLSLDELEKFMTDNYKHFRKSDIQLLMQGIKNGVYRNINLEVFGECINPFEFGYYQGYQNELKRLEVQKYTAQEKAQMLRLFDERVKNANQRSTADFHERRSIAADNKQRLEELQLQKERAQQELRRSREERRYELLQQRELRRDLILAEEELLIENSKNEVQQRELFDLRTIEQHQAHANYLLHKQAQINNMQLQETRRRAADFEAQLRLIHEETAKKRTQLLRQFRTDSPVKYHFGLDTHSNKPLHECNIDDEKNRLTQSYTYFKILNYDSQVPLQYFSPKNSLSLTASTRLDSQSRSRLESIELEMCKTQLQLEMRRNKVEMDERIKKQRQSLDRLRFKHSSRCL